MLTEQIIGYMKAFPNRFIFTYDERKDCLEIIRYVMKLVRRANEVKATNLEEEAFQTDKIFLRKALFLYIDNVGRDVFREIMDTYIIFEGYESRELLERLIILEGVTGIYNAESPALIEERLKAYLGEKLAAEYEIENDSVRKTASTAIVEEKAPQVSMLFNRKKVETTSRNPNVVLTQGEIDALIKTMLG